MGNISLLGDIAFTGLLSEEPEKNALRFSSIVDKLASSEIVIGNLEVPIKKLGDTIDYKDSIHFSLLEPTKSLLRLLNIRCLSLANNHIFDGEQRGLTATIRVLEELGILHTGAGWKQDHIDPVILKNSGKKIGFCAYVDVATNPSIKTSKDAYINYFRPKKVLEDIAYLKKEVDHIIVSIHWGIDYSFYATKEQVKIAHLLIDGGADVIMGHHSHTYQPFEIYNGKQIFYSLGGLCFGDYLKEGRRIALPRKTKRSNIYTLNGDFEMVDIDPLRELKGNYIKVLKTVNPLRKNKRKYLTMKYSHQYKIFGFLLSIQEGFIDRIFEYFFGYYKSPMKEFFEFRNILKIHILFQDFNWKRRRKI